MPAQVQVVPKQLVEQTSREVLAQVTPVVEVVEATSAASAVQTWPVAVAGPALPRLRRSPVSSMHGEQMEQTLETVQFQ
jgi:hypothetical protein